jgi:hypothetical protein
LINRARWLVFVGIATLLILMLTLFWRNFNEGSQHGKVLPDSVSQLPAPASKPSPMSPVVELSSPFSSSGFDPVVREQHERPAIPESEAILVPAVKVDDLHHEPPALPHEDSAADWGKWRKSDERQYGYLGGPPGPGKPAAE